MKNKKWKIAGIIEISIVLIVLLYILLRPSIWSLYFKCRQKMFEINFEKTDTIQTEVKYNLSTGEVSPNHLEKDGFEAKFLGIEEDEWGYQFNLEYKDTSKENSEIYLLQADVIMYDNKYIIGTAAQNYTNTINLMNINESVDEFESYSVPDWRYLSLSDRYIRLQLRDIVDVNGEEVTRIITKEYIQNLDELNIMLYNFRYVMVGNPEWNTKDDVKFKFHIEFEK